MKQKNGRGSRLYAKGQLSSTFVRRRHPASDAEAFACSNCSTASDWAVINEICNAHDLAPAEAIAMTLIVDQNLAMNMLNRWARAHGYA